MSFLHSSMRLKAVGGTFFFPDSMGGLYVRNHVHSFRMQGVQIQEWMEQLMPLFTGEHTLAELLDGLPVAHQKRVCEIADVLFQNGILRDEQEALEHGLSDVVRQTYEAQIEFLDLMGGHGARRFQEFRRARVVVVGEGSFLVAMAGALMQAGLQEVYLCSTDPGSTSRQRLQELAHHAQEFDPEIVLREVHAPVEEAIAAFDWVVYVSREGRVEPVRSLELICSQQRKAFFPAVFIKGVGMVGPLVQPSTQGSWESAWRRLHEAEVRRDPAQHSPSTVAEAMLANVLVLELLKGAGAHVEALSEFASGQEFFLLNLETLESSWHTYVPHPGERVLTLQGLPLTNLRERLEEPTVAWEVVNWFSTFQQLTSPVSGLFHLWEEGELMQLPLSQCRVQAVDPRSSGLANLLPSVVCAALTHEEARLEAGLLGVEMYVTRLAEGAEPASAFLGVGVGLSMAEAMGRGVQKCLQEELSKRIRQGKQYAYAVSLLTVVDEECQYMMEALTTAIGAPRVGSGPEVFGFPTVWVETNGQGFWGIGFQETLALREALRLAMQKMILKTAEGEALVSSLDVQPEGAQSRSLLIPNLEARCTSARVLGALEVLAAEGITVEVYEWAQEPFLQDMFAGVVGVVLREEERA